MKNPTFLLLITICLSFIACDDWLDVQPKSDIDLSEQISSAEGFKEMLNGVYLNMAGENLYGHHLMYGTIADAAQNHYSAGRPFIKFNYENLKAKEQIAAIWKGLYNVIANANTILDNIDAKKDLFNTHDFNMLKGEALAIRAFSHFDALRLFGDVYEGSTNPDVQIPYVNTFERKVFPRLPSNEVYAKILDDLNMAEELLKLSDPVYSGDYDGSLFDINKRKYRFHYYAVLALKARVYITMADYTNALDYATRVVNEFEWDWVNDEGIQDQVIDKDVLFFDEVITALNVQKLDDYYDFYFGEDFSYSYLAASSETNFAAGVFEITGPGINDKRFLALFRKTKKNQLAISTKYNQNWIFRRQYRSVPLIRITEMKLIMAEANFFTNNKPQAITILNELKGIRDVLLEDLSDDQVFLNSLIKEFRKETYLEGQVFYLYKRMRLTTIPTMDDTNTTKDVEAEDFIFPLPDNELEFNNNQN